MDIYIKIVLNSELIKFLNYSTSNNDIPSCIDIGYEMKESTNLLIENYIIFKKNINQIIKNFEKSNNTKFLIIENKNIALSNQNENCNQIIYINISDNIFEDYDKNIFNKILRYYRKKKKQSGKSYVVEHIFNLNLINSKNLKLQINKFYNIILAGYSKLLRNIKKILKNIDNKISVIDSSKYNLILMEYKNIASKYLDINVLEYNNNKNYYNNIIIYLIENLIIFKNLNNLYESLLNCNSILETGKIIFYFIIKNNKLKELISFINNNNIINNFLNYNVKNQSNNLTNKFNITYISVLKMFYFMLYSVFIQEKYLLNDTKHTNLLLNSSDFKSYLNANNINDKFLNNSNKLLSYNIFRIDNLKYSSNYRDNKNIIIDCENLNNKIMYFNNIEILSIIENYNYNKEKILNDIQYYYFILLIKYNQPNNNNCYHIKNYKIFKYNKKPMIMISPYSCFKIYCFKNDNNFIVVLCELELSNNFLYIMYNDFKFFNNKNCYYTDFNVYNCSDIINNNLMIYNYYISTTNIKSFYLVNLVNNFYLDFLHFKYNIYYNCSKNKDYNRLEFDNTLRKTSNLINIIFKDFKHIRNIYFKFVCDYYLISFNLIRSEYFLTIFLINKNKNNQLYYLKLGIKFLHLSIRYTNYYDYKLYIHKNFLIYVYNNCLLLSINYRLLECYYIYLSKLNKIYNLKSFLITSNLCYKYIKRYNNVFEFINYRNKDNKSIIIYPNNYHKYFYEVKFLFNILNNENYIFLNLDKTINSKVIYLKILKLYENKFYNKITISKYYSNLLINLIDEFKNNRYLYNNYSYKQLLSSINKNYIKIFYNSKNYFLIFNYLWTLYAEECNINSEFININTIEEKICNSENIINEKMTLKILENIVSKDNIDYLDQLSVVEDIIYFKEGEYCSLLVKKIILSVVDNISFNNLNCYENNFKKYSSVSNKLISSNLDPVKLNLNNQLHIELLYKEIMQSNNLIIFDDCKDKEDLNYYKLNSSVSEKNIEILNNMFNKEEELSIICNSDDLLPLSIELVKSTLNKIYDTIKQEELECINDYNQKFFDFLKNNFILNNNNSKILKDKFHNIVKVNKKNTCENYIEDFRFKSDLSNYLKTYSNIINAFIDSNILKYSFNIAYIYFMLGTISLKINLYEEAIKTLNLSHKIISYIPYNNLACIDNLIDHKLYKIPLDVCIELILGKLYKKSKDYNNALLYINNAITLSLYKYKDINFLVASYYELCKLYIKIKSKNFNLLDLCLNLKRIFINIADDKIENILKKIKLNSSITKCKDINITFLNIAKLIESSNLYKVLIYNKILIVLIKGYIIKNMFRKSLLNLKQALHYSEELLNNIKIFKDFINYALNNNTNYTINNIGVMLINYIDENIVNIIRILIEIYYLYGKIYTKIIDIENSNFYLRKAMDLIDLVFTHEISTVNQLELNNFSRMLEFLNCPKIIDSIEEDFYNTVDSKYFFSKKLIYLKIKIINKIALNFKVYNNFSLSNYYYFKNAKYILGKDNFNLNKDYKKKYSFVANIYNNSTYSKDLKIILKLYNNISTNYFNLKVYELSEKYSLKSFNTLIYNFDSFVYKNFISNQKTENILIYRLLNNLSLIFNKKLAYKSSINFALKSIEFLDYNSNCFLISKSYEIIADNYMELNYYDISIDYLFKSLYYKKLSLETNNYDLGLNYLKIGNCYRCLFLIISNDNSFNIKKKNYNETFCCNISTSKCFKSSTYLNINLNKSICFKHQLDYYILAVKFFNNFIFNSFNMHLFDKDGKHIYKDALVNMTFLFYNLGEIYFSQNIFNIAIKYYNKSIKYFLQLGNDSMLEMSYFYYKLCLCHEKLNNIYLSQIFLSKSIWICYIHYTTLYNSNIYNNPQQEFKLVNLSYFNRYEFINFNPLKNNSSNYNVYNLYYILRNKKLEYINQYYNTIISDKSKDINKYTNL